MRPAAASRLRLGPERQPEDRDEPDGALVVERVADVVRGERLVVQRVRASAADDHGVAAIEADPDLAGDEALGSGDVVAQVRLERR